MKSANGVPLNMIGSSQNTPRLFTLSTLRLFNALPIKSSGKSKQNKSLMEATMRNGFIFAPEVIANYTESQLLSMVDEISKEIGLSPEQMNASFHKSWTKVRDTPIFKLVIEQVMNYITTYGFESLGVYNPNTVYVPVENLKIPNLKDNVKLTVIRGYTVAEIKEKLLTLLNAGIALKEQTVKDATEIAIGTTFTSKDMERVKNKEVRVLIYDSVGIIPESPEEFLRLMIYKTTGKSLIIKSYGSIAEIKKTEKNVAPFFRAYEREYGLENLGRIFLRFKPLFLAFKSEEAMKPIVNQIRRLAKEYHKPMQPDFLNGITGTLSRGDVVNLSMLRRELSRLNTFRKIRLAYALNYRMSEPESIMYKIRNGKGYATTFASLKTKHMEEVYATVIKSITDDLRKNVKGKKIYIPQDVNYALPATEKQFTGNIPSGSYVSVPRDMVVGIYWENVSGNRIDIDLSLVSENSKYGWDGHYRNGEGSILFSGDMTDATNGATELFYMKKVENGAYILYGNYFNHYDGITVPYKILVAKEQVKDFRSNYMVNPNNILCVSKSEIKGEMMQKVLGLVVATEDECRFYFYETALGEGRSARNNEYSTHAKNHMITFASNPIVLNDLLERAGAVMVDKKGSNVIDLSPESLTKDAIITLLIKK